MSRNTSMLRALMPLALAVLAGCGSSALLSMKRGLMVEGRITGGDEDSVFVESESQEGNSRIAVPRADITDIDHPGNVAATLGGILGAYGIANVAVGAPACDQRGDGGAFCVGVFLPLTIALPIFIYGLVTWQRSRSAAASVDGRPSVRQSHSAPHYYPSRPEALPVRRPVQPLQPPPPPPPPLSTPVDPPRRVLSPKAAESVDSPGAVDRCTAEQVADMRSHGVSEAAIAAACVQP